MMVGEPHRPLNDHVRDHLDKAEIEEAWGIAVDLIQDLGKSDAVDWADDYMIGLRATRNQIGISRWAMVTAALQELAAARAH